MTGLTIAIDHNQLKIFHMNTVRIKELKVPQDIMASVAEILKEENLKHELAGGDIDQELVFIAVEYDKTSEQEMETLKEIEQMIEEYRSYE